MSLKALFTLFLLGMVFGGFLSALPDSAFRLQSREPASMVPKKNAPDLWGHSSKGKLNQTVQVEISAINGVAESHDQETALKAVISLQSPVQGDLTYQWILPDGVTAVAGEIEGVLRQPTPGEDIELELPVMGFNKEVDERTVVLQVFGQFNGLRMGSAGALSTQPIAIQLRDQFFTKKPASAESENQPSEEPTAE